VTKARPARSGFVEYGEPMLDQMPAFAGCATLAIGAALVVVLLFSAWQHFELLRHGYKLEQMQRERAAESDINRHLRLENETLRAPQRIEKLATERLGMVAPGDADAVVLERVAPQAPPAKSVVAAR
jgi:cell division protein FtsL